MPETMWRLENFSGGMHTKPGRAERGELFARDISDLEVDKDGWLTLRSELSDIGPSGANITGAAATTDYVFVLRADGRLYIRSIHQMHLETEVVGVSGMSGRISVVSPFGNYAVIKSEGRDQGYWVDLRDLDLSSAVQAHTFGIDRPELGTDFSVVQYPSDALVEATPDEDVEFGGPSIFVAYAISYVREFSQVIGQRDTEALFNGMESEFSEPTGFIMKRLLIRDDEYNTVANTQQASSYQIASFDFSPLYTLATHFPSRLVNRFQFGSSNVQNTHEIGYDAQRRFGIGYTVTTPRRVVDRLAALEAGDKIVFRPAAGEVGSDVVLTLSAPLDQIQNPDRGLSDSGRFLTTNNPTIDGLFVDERVYDVFPADPDGTIRGMTQQIDTIHLPDQVTGINIYRSLIIIDGSDSEVFDRLTELFLNDRANLDLTELLYRKIAYIPKDQLNLPFNDGIFAVKGDNADQRLNVGDSISDISTFRTYYDRLPVDHTNFYGVIDPVRIPGSGLKVDYPWYVDAITLGGLFGEDFEGVTVTVYGDAPRVAPIFTEGPLFLPEAPPEPAIIFYDFEDQPQADTFSGVRLPAEVEQIHYYQGRIYAPAGDRLLYSNIRELSFRIWEFPPANDVRPPEQGRVDFCADFQEVLLFGGRDGLWRLRGPDPIDFSPDRLSGLGPVDGYSWAIARNSVGFIGDSGLFITDAQTVEKVSDLALDDFFEGHYVQRGAVSFVSDDTILFDVTLDGAESFTFLFDDGYWTRWTTGRIEQFVRVIPIGEQFFAAQLTDTLKQIDFGMPNMDADQAWAWESNWIDCADKGAGEKTKRFTQLRITATPESDLTLRTYINNDERPRDVAFITRDDFYKQRVRIERRAKRLRFRLSGEGPISIRGLEIEGNL